ncbi:MAG TPA: DUF4166 domain-containing protein [Pseudonocardiaceae bacterium]
MARSRFHPAVPGFGRGATFALRVPSLVTGQALVRESYDDRIGQFRIEVAVTNRWFGPLFGYRGKFDVRCPVCDSIPVAVQPVREQLRV